MDTLLVADDLTGACDAAVHFAMCGLGPVLVRLPGHSHSGPARVLAVSTESRDMAPAEICTALRSVAAEFASQPAARVFKKIDSTLRGNIGMEVAASRDAFDCERAVVCPALPAMRRVVEGGVLHAPSLALVDVAALLRQQSGEACVHVSPRDLPAALATGTRMMSVDAATDADLDCIAAALLDADRRVLWAGSAGLASALARSLGETSMPPARIANPAAVLFCIGSDHAVTLAQQETLLTARPCILHAGGALDVTSHTVMRIPRGRITSAEVRAQLGGSRPAALMLSGGDTASLVCHAVAACAIELCAEIVPGVPYGILRGGVFDGLPVVTKSGGFGDRDTLVKVADFFHAPI